MTPLDVHRVPASELRAVAAGDASLRAVRRLALARRSRNLLLLRELVSSARRRRHREAGAAEAAYRTLAGLERVAPEAVAAVLHYPTVSAWLLATVHQLTSGAWPRARPGLLAAVTAAAAVRGRVALDIGLGTTGDVTLPSLGTATLPPGLVGEVVLRSRPGGAELVAGGHRLPVPTEPHRSAGPWRGVPVISAEHAGQRITIRLDASTMDGSRPPGHGAEHPPDAGKAQGWRARLDVAWRLLVRDHPRLAAELAALVTVLAPLDGTDSGLVGLTPNDAFGCIALAMPHDGLALAATLSHEIQHVKLSAVTDCFVLTDDGSERFYAPWRGDPRPAFALLHGVFAHLGIAGFWRVHRHRARAAAAMHSHIEFARWRAAASQANRVLLDSGRLTPRGRLFAAGMQLTLDRWAREPVPLAAARTANRLLAEHRRTWAG